MDFIYPKSMPKRYKVTMVLHTLFVLASGHLIAKTPLASDASAERLKAQSAKDAEDYLSCRKSTVLALRQAKDKVAAKRHAQAALLECRDLYPGVVALSGCKKVALTAHQADPAKLKAALTECQAQYRKLAYDPRNPIPLQLLKGEPLFAGIGLSAERLMAGRAAALGNFDCAPLARDLSGQSQPEYMLFGNEPRHFAGLSAPSGQDLKKLLRLKPAPKGVKERYFDSAFLGRFYQVKNSQFAAYFPSSFCFYAAKLGPLFASLKVYYLVDRPREAALPYFAAAFYNETAKVPSVDELATSFAATLGPEYKTLVGKRGVVFVAAGPIAEFDSEGDPLNLCRTPRSHHLVGVVKPHSGSKRAEVLILSNIDNLCNYGDRLAAHALKQGG